MDGNGCWQVIVVGAGGTGGYLIEWLARLAYGSRQADGPRVRLTLVDGDTVEEVNLVRQNFAVDDLGCNKARVLADACKDGLGVDVQASNRYIHDAADLQRLAQGPEAGPVIVIGAVDNNATRAVIDRFVSGRRGVVGIDSGNGERDGQIVVWGDPEVLGRERVARLLPPDEKPMAPVERFPEMADESGANANPDDQSCALHAQHDPQDMCTNIMAALGCLAVAWRLISGRPLMHYLYYFDIDGPYLKPARR